MELGTVWGLGQQHTFSQKANNSTNAWNGELLSTQFGSDIKLSNQWCSWIICISIGLC